MTRQDRRYVLGGSLAAVAVALYASTATTSGYPRYNSDPPGGNCVTCHGDFDDPTSPKGTIFPSDSKHEMHRASGEMNTDCTMCHVNVGDNPATNESGSDGFGGSPGPGCIGCHGRDYGGDVGISGAGLRRHHWINNVMVCIGCHPDDPDPLPESVDPFYYGSFDTNAFDACNTSPFFGENWSLDADNTDGLDNDGDNLYDTNDDDCGGCPWDCGGDNDGNVGIVDFLALLAQWGSKGTSCDFGEGDPGAGINEFLSMLARWGPCP